MRARQGSESTASAQPSSPASLHYNAQQDTVAREAHRLPSDRIFLAYASGRWVIPSRGRAVFRAAPDALRIGIQGGAEYRSAPAWLSLSRISTILPRLSCIG